MKIMSTMMMSMLVTFSLPLIFTSMSHNQKFQLNKMMNFECGFNQMSTNRISFSSQFFLIAILFLIFDLEISLILPLPTEENKMSSNITMASVLVMILMIGLMMEWKQGMMEWSK